MKSTSGTPEPGAGFLGKRLEESASELQQVRLILKETTERLGEAEGVIRFYGAVRNYKARRNFDGDKVLQDQLEGDSSPADNDAKTLIAGSRARAYLKKYA